MCFILTGAKKTSSGPGTRRKHEKIIQKWSERIRPVTEVIVMSVYGHDCGLVCDDAEQNRMFSKY